MTYMLLDSAPTSRRPATISARRRRDRSPRWPGGLYGRIFLWATLQVFALKVLGQRDPLKNFCRRFGHQTAVIEYQGRRRLYIDGGFVTWNVRPSSNNETNEFLLYQDLETVSDDGMPELYANLSKNRTVPTVHGGTLWADDVNKKVYLFGGEYSEPDSPATRFVLYAYDVIFNNWISLGPPQQANIDSFSYGAGVAISERGEGYYYGGWLSNRSVPGWSGPATATTGLVVYDMDDNAWRYGSGPDGVRRAEGVLLHVPASDGGMLVYFGGVVDPYANGTVEGQPLSEIFLYDVLSSKWYTQKTSGTAPAVRRRFCAGVTWPADQSSYNIYLYGGAGFPPNASGYDDVYVLSLPSFTWVKLWPTDGNYTGSSPHHSLTCNVVPPPAPGAGGGGAQMLIVGGWFPLAAPACDAPAQWGTHNLDLGEQNPERAAWQLYSPNKTAYAVPGPVLAVVGGDAAGAATRTSPAAGWGHPDLAVLMTRKASAAARTPTRAVPAAPGAAGGPHLAAGAVAGIAVGAAVVLLAAAAGLCCVVRRHAARRHSGSYTTAAAPGAAVASPARGAYSDGLDSPPWSPQSHGQGSPDTPASLRYLASPAAGQPPIELAAAETSAWLPGGGSPLGGGPGAKGNGHGAVWTAAPQELSPDPRADQAEAEGDGEGSAEGRGDAAGGAAGNRNGKEARVHHTYYHP